QLRHCRTGIGVLSWGPDRRVSRFCLRSFSGQGSATAGGRQQRKTGHRACRDCGRKPRGLHQAIFQRGLAGETPFPHDGQLQPGGRTGGRKNPVRGGRNLQAARGSNMMPGGGGGKDNGGRLQEQVACLGLVLIMFLAAARRADAQAAGGAPPGGYTPPVATPSAPAPSARTPSAPVPSGQAQSPFQGSVPTGQATGTTLALTLKDAFNRALQYNLGAIQSGQNTRSARAERLRNLSALLPTLYGQLSGSVEQINLQAQGLRLNVIPGVRIPTIVGPFSVADARAYLSQKIFNWSDIKNWKSASESETAAFYSYKSDRDLVVLVTATAYLQVIADAANVESNRAQVRTNQAIYQQNLDQNKQGVVA